MDINALAKKLSAEEMQQLIATWCVVDALRLLNDQKLENVTVDDVIEQANGSYSMLDERLYKDETIPEKAQELQIASTEPPAAVVVFPTQEMFNVAQAAVEERLQMCEEQHHTPLTRANKRAYRETITIHKATLRLFRRK